MRRSILRIGKSLHPGQLFQELLKRSLDLARNPQSTVGAKDFMQHQTIKAKLAAFPQCQPCPIPQESAVEDSLQNAEMPTDMPRDMPSPTAQSVTPLTYSFLQQHTGTHPEESYICRYWMTSLSSVWCRRSEVPNTCRLRPQSDVEKSSPLLGRMMSKSHRLV